MNLSSFIRKYADQIGGQYIAYDTDHSVVIVPVTSSRFQTVIGTIRENELYKRKLITLSSKITEFNASIDLKTLLEQTTHFNYSRFKIEENFLQIEAVASLDGIKEETLKEMIQEVANLADQYELKLTGADVH